MWRTQCGERILKGAEARVFAESLSTLLDNAIMDQFEDYESDVACFDNLTYGQKISVLATIGNGLFRKDVTSILMRQKTCFTPTVCHLFSTSTQDSYSGAMK